MKTLVRSAERADTVAMQRYRGGLTDYLDVLDAERTLFEAQTDYADAVGSAMSSYVTLYKLWAGELPCLRRRRTDPRFIALLRPSPEPKPSSDTLRYAKATLVAGYRWTSRNTSARRRTRNCRIRPRCISGSV